MTATAVEPQTQETPKQARAEVKIPVGTIKEVLDNLTRAIHSKSNVPILTAINVTASDGFVHFTSTDLETRIHAQVSGETYGEFARAIPAKAFKESLKTVKTGFVTLTQHGDGSAMVTLSANGFSTSLFTFPSDEYPAFPNLAPARCSAIMPLDRWKDLAARTLPSLEEARGAVLMGAKLELSGGQIQAVSTDGYRLAVTQYPASLTKSGGDPVKDDGCLLPGDFLRLLARFKVDKASASLPAALWIHGRKTIDANTQEVHATDESYCVTFAFGIYSLVVRCVDGQYPNWRIVIPAKFDRQFLVHRTNFKDAVSQATVVAGDRASMVKFTFDTARAQVTISAQSDVTGTFETAVPFEPIGGNYEDLTIAFNGKMLQECLDVLKSEEYVVINALGPLSPIAIDNGEPGADRVILMPLRQ